MPRIPRGLQVLSLVALALILTGPSLRFGFLSDDFLDLQHRFSAESFTRFEAGGFRPLTVALWSIDRAVCGPCRPWGWHMTNILLHAANTILISACWADAA
jgi:hypothetical protein